MSLRRTHNSKTWLQSGVFVFFKLGEHESKIKANSKPVSTSWSWPQCVSAPPSGSGVSSFCLHPGVIRTELGRHVQGWFPLLGALLSLPSLLLMKTPRQGSQTSVYCAVTPGLEAQTGRYFRSGGVPAWRERYNIQYIYCIYMCVRVCVCVYIYVGMNIIM